ncbi:hypothetical protein [Variovorax sp. KK3]|uniref:hypothetical protein n=1 Tax=Variovorax sp. KK3 TaxID=1855728 RepID=UPI00097C46F8|nr:hypothetical protein [Variovorax sp. KK3]
MEAMALRCAGCGANLEVDSDVDSLTCGYCKTPQEVVRRGGAIALKKVGDAIARVQRGTDKTAAELAIPRLERELAEREATRQRQLNEPARPPARRRLSNAVIWMAIGVPVLLFVMVGMSAEGHVTGFFIHAVWALWWTCIFGTILGYLFLRFVRSRDRTKAKHLRDDEINAEFEQETRKLRQQLARAREIVSEH